MTTASAASRRRAMLLEWMRQPGRAPVTAFTAAWRCGAYAGSWDERALDAARRDLRALESEGLARRRGTVPITWEAV